MCHGIPSGDPERCWIAWLVPSTSANITIKERYGDDKLSCSHGDSLTTNQLIKPISLFCCGKV